MTVAVVMGVSGSGKSTVAHAVADRLGWRLGEGDDLHPAENVEKMQAGVALTDADRAPWLRRVRNWIDHCVVEGNSGVITCSALERRYRDVLRRPEVVFVYLDVPHDELADRLASRTGHYMPASLLDSQLATLEPPEPDENALHIDATGPADGIVDRVVELLAPS